jgi:hypothetical protein
VAAAADGAGTAQNAERGAQLATDAFQAHVEVFLRERAIAELTGERLKDIVRSVREVLEEAADSASAPLRSFACTLLAVVVSADHACFCQIGDGAIIVADEGDANDWCWVFWPHRGEFANATSFLTDEDALDQIEIEVGHRDIEEVALLTDGIEKLVLQYDTQSVFAPFFETMFPPVRASSAMGEDTQLSTALATYLQSASVNQRTDDDKTLILASRRASGAAG